MQGIADALSTPDRLDEVLLDRLLTKCSEHLSPLRRPCRARSRLRHLGRRLRSGHRRRPPERAVRRRRPAAHVDAWVKSMLLQADEVIITAAPDLANLRNAKNIVDLLQQSRRNDSTPRLVMNMVNMPKRPEISVKEFAVGARSQGRSRHRLRQRDVRAGRQQRPDDRRAQRQGARRRRPSARSRWPLATGANAGRRRSRRCPLLEKLKLKR